MTESSRERYVERVVPASKISLHSGRARQPAPGTRSLYSSLAHHGRDQMLERRRAHLLDQGAGLDAQELEYALHAGLAEGAEAPEIRPAHADRPGAHAQRLDHVGAAAETGIDQDRHRAGDLHDL